MSRAVMGREPSHSGWTKRFTLDVTAAPLRALNKFHLLFATASMLDQIPVTHICSLLGIQYTSSVFAAYDSRLGTTCIDLAIDVVYLGTRG